MEKEKNVSFYLNNKLKSALKREVEIYSSLQDEQRNTIGKNISWILNNFFEENDIYKCKDLIINHLLADGEIDLTKMQKRLDAGLNSYPLLLLPSFVKKIDNYRKELNNISDLSFKITKMHFYTFILIHYFNNHKDKIIKQEIKFWSSSYFSYENDIRLDDKINFFSNILNN